MLATIAVVEGLLVAHVCLLLFFLIGSAAFPWCEGAESVAAPRAMTRVTVTCGLGMCIVGIAVFTLGLLGWLSAPSIVAATLIAWTACSLARRSSPFHRSYWRARMSALLHCWDAPLLIAYALMVVLSFRAILPNIGVSDPIWYHMAYAQDWVLAGRIYVDPFMVFPFFANNVILFFAGLFAFGGAAFINFFVWATALLIPFTVYGLVADCGAAGTCPWWRTALAICAALSVAATTIFLDLSVLAYVDVPIASITILSVAALVLALRERAVPWLLTGAVLGGFLIGSKGSFVLLIPLYAVALVWVGVKIGAARKATTIAVIALCLIAAPWYVRNFILAGDPIAPVFNLALYHDDGLITQSEWEALDADIATHRSPSALATLPIRAYLNPTSNDFREYGVTLLIVFLYLPTAVWLLLFAVRKPLEPEVALPIFMLSGFIVYWIVTSTLLRYALPIYPLLAVSAAMLLAEACTRWPRAIPVAVATMAIAALPSPGDDWAIQSFLADDFFRDYSIVAHRYYGQEAYLRTYEDGYREEQYLSDWIHRHGNEGTVYVIGDHLDYYFRANGVKGIGDYTGPAGYFRLLKAIDVGRAAEFLDDLNARAVMMRPNTLLDQGVQTLLIEQLKRDGYTEMRLPKSGYRILLRTSG